MASVVAMASVLEDFDTQPCKKSSKDGGSTVVKTITSYFSPVAKAVEKPRSNNIRDYFSRGPPTSKVKTSTSEHPKGICHRSAEKHTNQEVAVKRPSLKQRRAVTNARRKPVNLETDISSDEASCFIAEKSHGNTNSATDSQSVSAVTGSDTAALLAQINADTLTSNQSIESNTSEPIKQAQKEKHHEGPSGCEKDGKPGMNMSTNNTLLPKPAHHTRKKKQIEGNRSESEQKCVENSCAVSMELNGTEGSELKSNTVMISFEDFVRSQSEVKGDDNQTGVQCEGNKLAQEADEIETRQLRPSQTKENIASTELCVQVSPRTISIQAQMHTISPTREGVNPKGRGELLISRRKNQGSIGNEALRSHTELATAKRKSNVVLDEDELDLAVLESESFPKSTTEVERRHFMAAFKQPSLDGSKQKTAKIQGKQKQHAEKDPEEINIQENAMVAKTKPQRKCRKAAEKVTTSSKPPEETLPTKSDDIQEESDVSLNHSMPVVRRSRREVFVRQAIKASEASSTTDRWNPNNLKDPPENSKLSSPKRRKSKHGVYEAEMICPPDGKKGPIRITFRRVQQTVSGSGKNALASIALNNSKKQKKAKKLVEKAKAIQQIKKGAVEKKNPLRRSSRTEASSSKSYFEDENSIICLEEDQIASPQMGPQKSKTKYLRCLNDVLGKATKAPTVSKGTLTAQEKNVCRASAVISIFDDSSQEGSENSQDDEQFRARREFLKSGLPESFKKQMAKAAATKETYTRSCASFQPVIHVTQIPNDCPLWNLSWPKSPQLHCLKENCIPVSKPLLPLNGSFGMKTQPERGVFRARGSGWSLEMSEKVRQLLMDEVSTSNPLFASKTLMARLLARRADYQQQSEAGSIQSAPELVRGKRKRNPDDLSKVAKKQRATHPEGNIRPLEPSKRPGRTRQAQRARADMAKDSPSPVKDDVIVLDNLCEGTEKKVEAKDEVLWTEKYQPQQSSDIIGNTASVRRLHCWLKEWKLRADREERIKQKEKEREEGCNDSDWDCGEEDPLLAEDSLYNTVLITGPTGIGKTAAVYACAQELGFKVFEVNASSQRSGRLILSQLKEATQSHQVDSQGVNANKPAYFNSYSKGSSTGKQSTSPRKTNSPRRVVSSPRKGPNSPRGAKRGGLTPTSLANFFKTGQPSNKESASTKRDDQKSSPKKMKAQEDTRKQKDTTIKSTEEIEESSKKTAISLILFEEVDVIFEEDSGFLAAIKMFMSTTKRPVIVTTSDPAFSTVFDGNFEEVHFKTPSLLDVSSYLRLLCLAEGKRTDQHDVNTLLELNGCDIRQSLLQLQCWTRSAGGRPMMSPTADTNPNGNQLKAATCGEAADMCPLSEASVRPPCETGCTESLLGLLNIEPGRDVWEPLRNQTREIACWDLLMESTRRGVNLLYSNMESLFPLPRTQLISTYKPDAPHVIASACTQSDLLPPHARLLDSPESDDGSPVKVSNRMRRHSIPDQDGLHSDCDSEESFLSLCKQHGGSQEKEVPTEKLVPQMEKRKPLTPAERLKSVPVSKCLESISDFFNNMCDIDSLLVHHGADARRGNPQLSTVVKDGMTDEPRVEVDTLSWVMGERVVEVRTSAEALSFHKCRLSVAEAWDRAQQLEGQLAEQAEAELTLPVASHRESCSFTQSSLSQPQVVQQRRDLMESLVFRGTFSTLGNRSAFAVDYLPALRAICRSEQIREQGKVKRRFLHYLDSIHLGLHKNTLQYLSSDFP